MPKLTLESYGSPYIVIVDSSDLYYNGVGFEEFNCDNWLSYSIIAENCNGWSLNFPNLPRDMYGILQFKKSCESPDKDDKCEVINSFLWNGNTLMNLGEVSFIDTQKDKALTKNYERDVMLAKQGKGFFCKS